MIRSRITFHGIFCYGAELYRASAGEILNGGFPCILQDSSRSDGVPERLPLLCLKQAI